MDYVDHNYQLSQKNKIAFGIIAREKRIAAPDLSINSPVICRRTIEKLYR